MSHKMLKLYVSLIITINAVSFDVYAMKSIRRPDEAPQENFFGVSKGTTLSKYGSKMLMCYRKIICSSKAVSIVVANLLFVFFYP